MVFECVTKTKDIEIEYVIDMRESILHSISVLVTRGARLDE